MQEDAIIARGENDALHASMVVAKSLSRIVATVRREVTEIWEVELPANARLRVDEGQSVQAGDQLTEGAKNPKEILRISGREQTQLYLLSNLQRLPQPGCEHPTTSISG